MFKFLSMTLIAGTLMTSQALAYNDTSPSTKVMTQGINHLGLTVSQLNKSTQFFTDILGWKVVGGFDDYPSKFVTDGKIFLTLWQTKQDKPVVNFSRKHNVGLHHLALTVGSLEDLHELHRRFKKNNDVIVEFSPEFNGKGPTTHMMIREPSGNRLEFSFTPKK